MKIGINGINMKKIKFIFIMSIFVLMYTVLNVYGYDIVFTVNDNENEYNAIDFTSDGGLITVGCTNDGKSAYIASYDINGQKIKEKTYEHSWFNSAIQTKDKGYIAVGRKYYDALIVKFDSNLNVIWENTHKGHKYNEYYSVIETLDGDIVAVGVADEENGNTEPAKGLITKYDENGNMLWENTIGGTSYDVFNSVVETQDGCYIVVGTIKSKDIENLEINGEADAVVLKYNSQGELLWKKAYGGSSYDEFNSIIKTKDGGYITVGSTASFDIDNITDEAQWKCLVVKYDKDFNLLWNTGYGSGHASKLLSVIELPNNDIIAVGTTHTVVPIQHGIIIQYDSKGNIISSESTEQEEKIRYNSIDIYDNNFIIVENNLTYNTSKIIRYCYSVQSDEKKENNTVISSSNNGSINKDTTVANGELPQAGFKTAIFIIFIVMIIGMICYFKYNKLRDIK